MANLQIVAMGTEIFFVLRMPISTALVYIGYCNSNTVLGLGQLRIEDFLKGSLSIHLYHK